MAKNLNFTQDRARNDEKSQTADYAKSSPIDTVVGDHWRCGWQQLARSGRAGIMHCKALHWALEFFNCDIDIHNI